MAGRRRRSQKDQTPPVSGGSLAANLETGRDDQVQHLSQRIARYSLAKQRAVAMRDYLNALVLELRTVSRLSTALDVVAELAAEAAADVAGRLGGCGEYLRFRHYYTAGLVLLHEACFCRQHLVCPLCAIRRGNKALDAYLKRFAVIRQAHPELWPYLMTFTVRDGPDLQERFTHLYKSFRRLQDRRRLWLSGVRGNHYTEFAKIQGAVGSYEFKRGSGSGLWHPHIHMIGLAASPPSQAALREEWKEITGRVASATDPSFMVDVTPFYARQDPVEGFMEVFKYAVKFSSFSCEDNWHAAQVLKASRLMFSFGLFRGVEVPEALTDEPLDELPYFELFYRYLAGAGYSLVATSQFLYEEGE